MFLLLCLLWFNGSCKEIEERSEGTQPSELNLEIFQNRRMIWENTFWRTILHIQTWFWIWTMTSIRCALCTIHAAAKRIKISFLLNVLYIVNQTQTWRAREKKNKVGKGGGRSNNARILLFRKIFSYRSSRLWNYSWRLQKCIFCSTTQSLLWSRNNVASRFFFFLS